MRVRMKDELIESVYREISAKELRGHTGRYPGGTFSITPWKKGWKVEYWEVACGRKEIAMFVPYGREYPKGMCLSHAPDAEWPAFTLGWSLAERAAFLVTVGPAERRRLGARLLRRKCWRPCPNAGLKECPRPPRRHRVTAKEAA